MTKQVEYEEVPASSWDMVRYLVVFALIGFAAWYYYSQKPVAYAAQQTSGKTMGTDYSVKVNDFPSDSSGGHDAWNRCKEEIQAKLDAIDRSMSTFKKDSEVCRFNAFDSTEWFEVSKELAGIVRLAIDISESTSGAFDITVAPLVDLWGFGPDKSPPDAAELAGKSAEIKQRIGYEKLEVRFDPPALKKSLPALTIDLSAIAKGYAADAVAELLEQKKILNYMIEVGGEVRCRGNKGKQGEWTIGIEKPLIVPPDELPGLQRKKLHLGDRSLATSGDSQNFRRIGGMLYSHIIDPRTGFPTEKLEEGAVAPKERLGSVSVIDKSCARADALATGLFVLGEKEGLELARREKWAVLYLIRTGDTEDPVREAATPEFPKNE